MKQNSFHFDGLIDLHSHILPEMDDGSESREMSMQMLIASAQQGVRCMVATPHFYPSRDYPDHFLAKRDNRLARLNEQNAPYLPRIIPGAEVQYFDGITEMADLSRLRIGYSTALLVEMPFSKWTNRMAADILLLNNRREFRVVLAHIERYIGLGNEIMIRSLASEGVLFQANASLFQGKLSAMRGLKMLDEGLIHLLGSDCHNMDSRPPDLSSACSIIGRKRGMDAIAELNRRCIKLLMTQDEPLVGPTVKTEQMV